MTPEEKLIDRLLFVFRGGMLFMLICIIVMTMGGLLLDKLAVGIMLTVNSFLALVRYMFDNYLLKKENKQLTAELARWKR